MLEVMRQYSSGDDNLVSREYLVQAFAGTTKTQLEEAIQLLLSHGSILEIDDNHWRASSSS